MNINIFQETNPVAAGNVLVGAIALNSNPNFFVQHFTYPDAYDGRTQLHSFIGVLDVVYRYVCFESPDGSASGTARNDFEIKPNNNAYLTRDDLYLVVDLSPNFVSNTSFYGPDPTLVGWNWSLERVGFGTQEYGVDYVKTKAGVDTTQDDLNADGWRLLQDGLVLQPSEKYVIHFLPQLSQITTAPSNIISSIVKITTNTTLDNDAPSKSYLIQGASGYLRLNLPSLASIPDSQPIYFYSAGGNHINVGIFTSNTNEPIIFFPRSGNLPITLTDHIYLGQGETLALCKFTDASSLTYWIVVLGGEGISNTGKQILSYSKQHMNTVLMQGQLLSRANYPRLWEWVSNLESGIVINDSAFNNTAILGPNNQAYFINQGRFTLGDGSTTFRIPNLSTYGFQKFTQGIVDLPGTFEVGMSESHSHTMDGTSFNGPGGPFWLARNVNQAYSGGGADSIGRKTGSPDATLRTGNDNSFNSPTLNFENRPNTFKIYPLIGI